MFEKFDKSLTDAEIIRFYREQAQQDFQRASVQKVMDYLVDRLLSSGKRYTDPRIVMPRADADILKALNFPDFKHYWPDEYQQRNPEYRIGCYRQVEVYVSEYTTSVLAVAGYWVGKNFYRETFHAPGGSGTYDSEKKYYDDFHRGPGCANVFAHDSDFPTWKPPKESDATDCKDQLKDGPTNTVKTPEGFPVIPPGTFKRVRSYDGGYVYALGTRVYLNDNCNFPVPHKGFDDDGVPLTHTYTIRAVQYIDGDSDACYDIGYPGGDVISSRCLSLHFCPPLPQFKAGDYVEVAPVDYIREVFCRNPGTKRFSMGPILDSYIDLGEVSKICGKPVKVTYASDDNSYRVEGYTGEIPGCFLKASKKPKKG